jgi:hypothetical protein
MKERPIIFSGESVRAILDDRKTQTRRVVKPQPTEKMWYQGAGGQLVGATKDPGVIWCPYGDALDRLWVRETWQIGYETGEPDIAGGWRYSLIPPTGAAPRDGRVFYRADYPDGSGPQSWRPSIHMPKWACLLRLRVVDVRVERVQEISEEDALAEGATGRNCCEQDRACGGGCGYCFRHGWDSLNTKRGHAWETNPWVWVITFEKLDRQ